MRRVLVWLTGLCLGIMVTTAMAGRVDFSGMDITGSSIGGDFALTTQQGRVQRLSDYSGKVVVLFFGYAHCPDVCPTTLMNYVQVMKGLGSLTREVQVIFVTVDPERDTVPALASYIPRFDQRFIGMTGSQAQIDKVKSMYNVIAHRVPLGGAGYVMDHTAGTFLLDDKGRPRVYEAYGAAPSVLVHDIKVLLGYTYSD